MCVCVCVCVQVKVCVCRVKCVCVNEPVRLKCVCVCVQAGYIDREFRDFLQSFETQAWIMWVCIAATQKRLA